MILHSKGGPSSRTSIIFRTKTIARPNSEGGSSSVILNRLILIVGLTHSQGSNLYQNFSLANLHLEWDRLVIDLKVPGEKTKSLWSSRTC